MIPLKYVTVIIQIFMKILVVLFKFIHRMHQSYLKIQGSIRLNLFLNTDLKNEQDSNEVLKIFDSFFKKNW